MPRERSSSPQSDDDDVSEHHPDKNWKDHAEKDKDSKNYTCTFMVDKEDGSVELCGYHSKKHLVKRHIDSVHLDIRSVWIFITGSSHD